MDQNEIESLRTALNAQAAAAGRPRRDTQDLLADVEALLPAVPVLAGQLSPASLQPPAPVESSTVHQTPSLPERYAAVKDDPARRAAFLREHSEEIRREFMRQDSAAFASRQARDLQARGNPATPIHPADLIAVYESVKSDPVKRAKFLRENAEALNALLCNQ